LPKALSAITGLLRGGKSPIWWNFFENDFDYCSAISDSFGNLKYVAKNSGTCVSYGIKKKLKRIFFGASHIAEHVVSKFVGQITKSAQILCVFLLENRGYSKNEENVKRKSSC
jgi:hypothetical protein